MSDLIDRQVVLEAIGKMSDEIFRNKQKGATIPSYAWFDGMASAEDIIKSIPPVHPRIIYCKDCKWRNDFGHWLGCPVLNVDDDNFCSMAERRTDEPDK